MLSTGDLERLIIMKRREIEKEKTSLGLSSPVDVSIENVNGHANRITQKENQVNFTENIKLSENGAESEVKEESDRDTSDREVATSLPPDLDRYIRRYLGLPVMLKAGEYSPNNPLIRGERSSGDVLLGLGEYERRRNTLRKLRQQQYREYLDQQAKKKQEAKEQAEKERREHEERERERVERENVTERERYSPERRRASICYVASSSYHSNKVDTGVQVDSVTSPLSVAVQTDDTDLFNLPSSPSKSRLTQAERELSPRTVDIRGDAWGFESNEGSKGDRRRSCGDYSMRAAVFDADAIQQRNLQAEKEAAERRQFYQQELKNQILEQQRIKEERKTREKMLEQAEMRRLEEQLRMLRMAHEREIGKQRDITNTMKNETLDYTKKRNELQEEIETEQKCLIRAITQPVPAKRTTHTSRSDTPKLPLYYPPMRDKEPFSTNIPDNSIFSPNYDVDSYLRRNLNFKENVLKNRLDSVKKIHDINIESIGENRYDTSDKTRMYDKSIAENRYDASESRTFDKIIVHERPKDVGRANKKTPDIDDTLPIPVLRHSPLTQPNKVDNANLSDAMKLVDDKWKVPVVQKNILKSLPNDEGKSVSILTQLGSIRRQLQLEQLKLDRIHKDDDL